ncbi:hypothetical protein TWF569_000841 [Orbilia oligospora]|nr:hypothetical protein TWF706_010285 [Orbilia oligospora]KAF3125399.1 hypothetical protein TWF569_000841 [Orbilia oligospora]KAF3140439.1 hypothetical protein TWF594_006408 [Orbilia oligospora]
MWILDTDTDLLGGRRTWVRPGAEAILGRTQFAGATQKAISRRHIVLKVDEVPKYDGLSIRHYSSLTLKDESKKGSTVDGRFINGTSVVLDPAVDHEFQMATAPQIFRLRYEPQIFTIHNSSKKKSADPKVLLKDYLSKLEQLDIKCIPEFLPGKTTVAVVTKRNLPISLRALVNGAWVVTSAFVDAIAAAATKVRGDNGDLLDSPLQEDIVANWPDPLGFLPPPGQEPNPKAPEYFKPNPKRKTMFEKWVVVCCTQQHMDIFTGPITDGGGKTDLFNLREGKTKPAELIVHIDRFGKKVIVLHPNVEGDWYVRFRREVEERTGVRFAEQNEFLDAVLMADAGELAKPYEAEESSVVVHESIELPAPPPSTEVPKESQPVARRTRAHDHEEEVTKPEPSQMPPPTRTSTTSSLRTQTRSSRYVSQIKIDDSDDDDFTPLPPPPSSSSTTAKFGGAGQSVKAASGATAAASFSSHTISQGPGKNTQLSVISETQQPQSLQSQVKRRRIIPSDDDDDEDDNAIMDRMLTGQATMKRRKVEEEAKRAEAVKLMKILPSAQRKTEEPPTPEPESIKMEQGEEEEEEVDTKPTKGKKKAVDSKVIQTAQEIRRREEARAAEEDAANEMSPEEIAAVAKMRNLAIIEVFEIAPRTGKPTGRSQAYGDEGDRWDNAWNGRRNFKKFKKRSKNGEVEGPMRRMGGHIMVPLVEHKAKDFGIGEGYWVEPQQSSVAAGKRRESPTNVSHVSETQIGGGSAGRSGKGVMEVVVDISDEEFFEEETARDESLATKKSQGRSQKSQGTQQASGRVVRGSTRGATQTSTAPAKRTTSNRNSVSEEPAKKKAKTMAIFDNEESEDEDSDDDELKFTFRQRGRG